MNAAKSRLRAPRSQLVPKRSHERTLAVALALFVVARLAATADEKSATDAPAGMNLAPVATASTSFVSGHETIDALNDDSTPANSNDKRRGAYGNWPKSGTQWVQYEWSQPIATRKIDVYWFDDHRGVRLPTACRLKYWDGRAFVDVKEAVGLGLAENRFNTTTFAEVTTSKLRLEMDSDGTSSTGILEWRVYDSGKSPNFPPVAEAGVDRVVILGGATHLSGAVRDDLKVDRVPRVRWSKQSGPGNVAFGDAESLKTTARFSAVGDYVLRLTADDGALSAFDTVGVSVDAAPPEKHLTPVWTKRYTITSPLWRQRVKMLIVNWIPHCIRKIDDPQLREGGIDNFVQAADKLAGRPHTKHLGYPFSNAWVYNTLESMCWAQMIDPQGDRQIAEAQAAMRATIDAWIPKILGAQEPDGYLQTMYTISDRKRWSNKHDHEGYNAGYFIEAAIAHHLMTDGKDTRLWEAAKRLADLWCDEIGPAPKRTWYEGHQGLEQALVRMARYVEEHEGRGKGRKYVDLAKFLMDCRRDGAEYDQSHVPVTEQYEGVGHAVRAVYSYSAMADIAMETGDIDYHSAVKSLCHSVVNRKYYVTGGVGSGETAEGFGKEYSLPNSAYCESCSGCGELFFQHKMQLAYHDARYADLYEETLFNAILGSVDLDAKNFTYTNALDSSGARYLWHVCPCCVGNIPRTILQMPTWTYATSDDGLYVSLFVGSRVTVEDVAGTTVEMVQTTDYPWSGKVSIAVNPREPKRFSIRLRAPRRDTSTLYTGSPACEGIRSLAVNGAPVKAAVENGYAVLTRDWKPGDTIAMELPMVVQRVKAVDQIAATRGRVALRYGPLVYNIESVDQDVELALSRKASLTTQWRGDLLDGVMVIRGTAVNGAPLLAIPNYARLNRGGRSIVWLKDE